MNGKVRNVTATVLLCLAVVLTPASLTVDHVRQLVADTEAFVATFGPLADNPAVQSAVTAVTVEHIRTQMPAAASTESPASGVMSRGTDRLLTTAVSAVVTSPEFSTLWRSSLAAGHRRANAVLDPSSDAVIRVDAEGIIVLDLGAMAAPINARLLNARLSGISDTTPEVAPSSLVFPLSHQPTVGQPTIGQVRTFRQTVMVLGAWLPPVNLALFILGLAVARPRRRAIVWTAAGLLVAMGLLAAGLLLGRQVAVGSGPLGSGPLGPEAAKAIYMAAVADLLGAAAIVAIGAGVLCAGAISTGAISSGAISSGSLVRRHRRHATTPG